MTRHSDYRGNPWPGGNPQDSLSAYLLGPYLNREDWVKGEQAMPESLAAQPYHTERHPGGHLVQTEDGGKPKMKDAYLDRLSGTPWQIVKRAVELVKEVDPIAIQVLEWHQAPRARKPSRYRFAADLGMEESNLSRRFKSAVKQIHDHLGVARAQWEARL